MRFLRKLFTLILILAIIGAGLYVYARYVEPGRLSIERVEIGDIGLESPMRLVVFSDTHLGNGFDNGKLTELVETINKQQGDVVLFLGDFFDDYSTYTGDAMADAAALAGIDAPVKLAVWGNHDMGGKAYRIYPQVMEAGGFTLLENASYAVSGGVNFVGVADLIFGQPSVEGLLTDGVNILLSHEPDFALEVDEYIPLQLSGHSHGGQVYLPFIGAPQIPQGAQAYLRGMYEKADGGRVYVNRGIGMSIVPFRFGAVPELTVVDIR